MAQFFENGSNAATSNFNSATAGQTGSYFLPSIYSKKVLNFFRKSSVAEAITNTDYEGEISSYGDSVKIVKEPVISVNPYTRAADPTQTFLSDKEESLVVDTANAFKFVVDDIEGKMSHVNWKEAAASSAAYALKDAYDVAILAKMFAGVSGAGTNSHGGTFDHLVGSDSDTDIVDPDAAVGNLDIGFASGELDPLDLMARMARLLDEQNVPEEGRFFVAPPSFYEVLSQSGSKLLSVDYNAGQGSVRNGLVSSGKLRGFEMYKSNNIAAPTSAAGKCLAGHVSATATAQTIVNTEVLRDQNSFGDICRGLHVFGAKVIRPEALVSAHYGID
jgi:hypothetical protein